MKKFVRKFGLLFKSISIQLETRRLKKEIKSAYSENGSNFKPGKLVLVITMVLVILGIGALAIRKNRETSQNNTALAHIEKKNQTEETKSDDTLISKLSDTLSGVGKRGDSLGVTELPKKSDSNIIKKVLLDTLSDTITKYLLIADKGDRIVHLFKRAETGWLLTRTFPVASGAKSGKKMVSGDLRTPEGIYFIEGRKEGDSLNEIYGPLAYVLNYPNRHDKAAGRTGNGIWIHGTTPGEVPVDTKGCLELHNDNLIKLAKILGKGDMIPVVIHSKSGATFEDVVNLDSVWIERNYILKERYDKIVAEQRADSLAKAEIARADSLKQAEKFKADSLKTARVAREDSIKAVQVAREDSIKAIQVAREDSLKRERIARADSLERIRLARADSIKSVRKIELERISETVNEWAELWETMKIDSYAQAYDTTSFSIPGYNWKKWKKKKIGTFERYSSIDIEVSKVRPKLITDSTAVVVFNQVYQSNLFRSVNKKKLSMKKINSQWKITAEVSLP